MFPLNAVLRGLVKQGRLKVIDCDGKSHEFGQPDVPLDVTISLRDPDTARKIGLYPAMNLGEAYTDGTFVIEEGTLLDFLRLMLLNKRRWNESFWGQAYNRAEDFLHLPAVFNPVGRSRKNVKHHYDLSEELFALFLDSDRQYSCAYFRSPDADLEQAQLNKRQHIAAKLNIQPDQHILDIGSGWGGLGLYLAQQYPVRVTGLTLSDEQYRVSNARARQLGIADRVEFKLLDYRQETGTFDRIVSVGMFEHVGKPQFSVFFHKLHSLLKPDGVALVHTIAYSRSNGSINPWLRRYIFPGAYLPSLSQLAPVWEHQRFWLTDLENLRLHYALTLAAWYERFQTNREQITRLYDERFCRMWEFYLQSCEAGFRWGGLTVLQFQLAKDIAALPITRDYMVREEDRLRENRAPDADGPNAPLWIPPPWKRDNGEDRRQSRE